jgi:Fic family protein
MATAHHEVELRWDADPNTLGGRRARRGLTYRAYVPEPIADTDPALPASLLASLVETDEACRELEHTTEQRAVNLETLARQLLRAESVASSRIEGLVVSHRRLAKVAFAGGDGDFAAQSVLQNIQGMEYAMRLAVEAPVLTKDTFADIHRAMFTATRDGRYAGVIRDRQNWIGGEASTPANAEFIPPPHTEIDGLLADLAAFCERSDLSPVLQAAIAHAQFETIHPFWDGNGRVGRALIHVVLRRRRIVDRLLPPVSLVLADNADAYVMGLTNYRYGDESDWYGLFADALHRAAIESAAFGERVEELQERWSEQADNSRRGSAAAKLIDALPTHPVVNLRTAVEITGASEPAVLRAFERLERAGVLRQTSAGRRNRAFECVGLFALMDDFERRLGPAHRAPAVTSASRAAASPEPPGQPRPS